MRNIGNVLTTIAASANIIPNSNTKSSFKTSFLLSYRLQSYNKYFNYQKKSGKLSLSTKNYYLCSSKIKQS